MRTIASVRAALTEGMVADARQGGICKARRERIMFDSHSQVDARRAAEEESAADEVEVRCPPPRHAPSASSSAHHLSRRSRRRSRSSS